MENNARPNQHLRKQQFFAGGKPQGNGNNQWLETGMGKLPPQAVDLEEAVLGALMIEKDALSAVVDILKPQSFYKDAHQRIYAAIVTLFTNSEPIDMLTVKSQLARSGDLEFVGGASYLAELTMKVNSAANIEYHSRVVTEHSLKRSLITMATAILKKAYEDTTDVFQMLDETEQELFSISESNIKKNTARMNDIVTQAIKELEQKKNQEGLTGVPSGFTSLDRLTSGWQPTELVILAARPAMGKTAFVVTALRNAAVDHGRAVAIFSLEMSAVQLVNRLISAEAEIDSEKIRKGNLLPHEWQQLHHKIQRLSDAPIYIDDTPALTILELRAKCRRLKAQHDIQLVVIDYLQLMSGDSSKGGNREQEIASISRALKNLAKELNVPVIALSQLSRAVETRGGDKKPQLSDLRESGCLTGDTLLIDANTGQRVSIQGLAEKQANGGFSTIAATDGWKLGNFPVSKVFYSGQKPVFALKTRSGRSIKATANHPFLKLGGWARLDELHVGDAIAVPRRIAISQPTNPLSADELTLLAHLIGDGCGLPKQPYHYTSADPANLEIVRQTAQRLFGIEGRLVDEGSYQHIYLPAPHHLTHGVRHPITDWYARLGLERVRSYEKKLPDALFSTDRQHIALFLHHLWATDGNISRKKLHGRQPGAFIYYASPSDVLARQVQHLLLRLDILSTIRTVLPGEHRPMHNVYIEGKANQLPFLQQVGCYGQRGEIVPELILALESVTENVNYDVIPKEAWLTLINACKIEQQLSWRTFSAMLGMSYCGSTLFKHGISRQRMQRIHGVLPNILLKNLAESDVLWDEIVAIEPLGIEAVYDATVPGVHNFVANDIIVHNSIEQDADMVMFLYRPEYYNITQDEAGNSTAGIGEVIVAKNRSGSLDTIQLRFISRYTKFTDLDGYYEPVADTSGFSANVNGLSSFDAAQPAGAQPGLGGGILKSRANDLSQFGNADPNQQTPF